MSEAKPELATNIIGWVISSGAGFWIAKWGGEKFFEWLKSYNARLVTLEKSVTDFEKKVDIKLERIETSLEFLKDNKEKLSKREDKFEDGVVKILRNFKAKGRFE